MIECDQECLYWPHKVRVTSELGTAFDKISTYCAETFGLRSDRWDIESYMWEYELYFKYESDFVLFTLKWK